MRAGKLRHRVELQSLVPTQDPVTGAITETWTTFATRWASVEPLSARERMAAQSTSATVTARIVLRYMDGLLPSMRAVHDTHTYNIEGVIPDLKSGREYLTLPVSEVLRG